ncbi:MAG: hypothetical protein OXK21_03905, partial [Chloroflexota bacterium]|nr:hypothetical protein [Chloroflexota bacterium]
MNGRLRFGYLLMALLVSMALVVAGCSGGDDDGDSGGSAMTTDTSTTTTAAAEPASDDSMTKADDSMMMEGPKPVYGGKITFASSRDVRSGFDPHGTSGGQSQHQNTNSWWYNNL